MKLLLNENIRIYRKKMSLTQEQLAEAMGVSVATVSKWEGGSICPDVVMLAELADFFQISVDVLLGYEWRTHNMGQCVDNIKRLLLEQNYKEGASEARKAIQKYPNSFDVMYICGEMLLVVAINHISGKNAMSKEEINEEFALAARTLERALELFDQNSDKNISRISIHQHIGSIYGYMGEQRKAVEYLEKHNEYHFNDRMIGIYLCALDEYDKAWHYATEVFRKALIEVWVTYMSVYNVLFGTGRYNEAAKVSEWGKEFCMSVADKESSYFERAAVTAETMGAIALVHCLVKDGHECCEEVKSSLRGAILKAKHFDENPDFLCKIAFFKYEAEGVNDGYGTTISAIKYIIRTYASGSEAYELVVRIYNELVEELGLDNEAFIMEEDV